MTSGIDGFGPKVIWRFKLRHHSSCHINKCPVLPLRYTILLRGIRSGILMPNPLFTQEFIHGVCRGATTADRLYDILGFREEGDGCALVISTANKEQGHSLPRFGALVEVKPLLLLV